MLTNKSISFCVLHVLQEYSDSEHILQMNEILSRLKARYDLTADRRTIYSAVEALCLMGYDISTFEENGKGYFLRSRIFEPSEVRLLTDRIYSIGYISKHQTEDLLQKLQSTQSVHQRKKYRHLKVAKAGKKTPNQEIFLNVELLDEAIDQGVQVEFDYMQYGLDKKLLPRRDRSYLVNPYQMVAANEKYYLVCNYDAHSDISHYRIDLIKNIRLSTQRIKPLPEGFDLSVYSDSLTYMFGGKNEPVEILCDHFMVTEVVDRFGQDCRLAPYDDKRFRLILHVPPRGIKFWALQYLPYCEVTHPQWLREEIISGIRQSSYAKDGI